MKNESRYKITIEHISRGGIPCIICSHIPGCRCSSFRWAKGESQGPRRFHARGQVTKSGESLPRLTAAPTEARSGAAKHKKEKEKTLGKERGKNRHIGPGVVVEYLRARRRRMR